MNIESFNYSVSKYTSYLQNEYVAALLLILLITYLPYLGMNLSQRMRKILNKGLVKVIYIWVLLLTLKYRPYTALVAAVAFVLVEVVITKIPQLRKRREGMTDITSSVNNSFKLGEYQCKCDKITFYDDYGNAIPKPQTEEGKLLLDEAIKAEEEGILTPEGTKKIAETVAAEEENNIPVMEPITAEAEGEIEKIKQAVESNKIKEEDAHRLITGVLVQEKLFIASNNQEEEQQNQHKKISMETELESDSDYDYDSLPQPIPSLPTLPTLEELAEEVIQMKESEESITGMKPTPQKIKSMCNGVINKYHKSHHKSKKHQVKGMNEDDDSLYMRADF